jgi:hypothetical protein
MVVLLGYRGDELALGAAGLKFCPLSDKSGQSPVLAGNGLSAYDPKRTLLRVA